jgi:hypothetical protein
MASGDTVFSSGPHSIATLLSGKNPKDIGNSDLEGYRVKLRSLLSGSDPNIREIDHIAINVCNSDTGQSVPSSPFDKTKTYDLIIKEH